MWKKASFVLAASALLLVGCNNNDNDVPPANETPMEDVRDEGNNLGNDVEDAGQRLEDDLTDDDRNLQPDVNRGTNDQGIENGTNGTYNNGTNGTTTNGTTVNEEEILKDDMNKNK
ncbi:hypothetical protein [Paenisporosarcina indica]|uniref:hypothetical protein n=1 Tax=Paenisporosarcina indica TaxID=650093 RepID=UPI0009502F6A|nr:hypothetical protein [Paenisporosarcina indica]